MEKAREVLRKHGLKILGVILAEVIIASAAVFALIFLIDKRSQFQAAIFAGVLVGAILLIRSLNRMIYAFGILKTASYVKKHPMDILYVNAESYSRTVLSYLEGGRLHFKDKATYILDGEAHHARIYKMLRDDRDDRSLMIFRDKERMDIVFAVPAIYVKDLMPEIK